MANYIDYFQGLIDGFIEGLHTHRYIPIPGHYHLAEDLIIVLAIARHFQAYPSTTHLPPFFWKELVQRMAFSGKTMVQLKNRYLNQLRFLQLQEFQEIYAFTLKEGLSGSLVFEQTMVEMENMGMKLEGIRKINHIVWNKVYTQDKNNKEKERGTGERERQGEREKERQGGEYKQEQEEQRDREEEQEEQRDGEVEQEQNNIKMECDQQIDRYCDEQQMEIETNNKKQQQDDNQQQQHNNHIQQLTKEQHTPSIETPYQQHSMKEHSPCQHNLCQMSPVVPQEIQTKEEYMPPQAMRSVMSMQKEEMPSQSVPKIVGPSQQNIRDMHQHLAELTKEEEALQKVIDELALVYGMQEKHILWLLQEHDGQVNRLIDFLEGMQ